MYQNSIKELKPLAADNMENIFHVYQDETSRYFYNLLQTINIPTNLPKGYYDNYTVKYFDTWPFISYKAYETPNLWWIIVAANNILNPVIQPEEGTVIKILKTGAVRSILSEIEIQLN